MIITTRILQDSGAKSAAQTRTRKPTTRKTKSTETVADAASTDDSLTETIPVSQVEQSMPQARQDIQEDTSNMAQSHSEQSWQEEGHYVAENEHGYRPDAQGAMEYAEHDGYYEGEIDSGAGEQYGQNQNQIMLTLSYSLMNHVRQVARMEGVFPEDILIELIAEGVTRRAFEDAQRPAPSHLMTRTGYVAPDANGNVQQPQLSHHGMQGNQRGNHQGHNNRRFHQNNNRGNHFQGRNRQNQFKNKPRNGNGHGNGNGK